MVVPGGTVVNGVVDAAPLDAENEASFGRRSAVASTAHQIKYLGSQDVNLGELVAFFAEVLDGLGLAGEHGGVLLEDAHREGAQDGGNQWPGDGKAEGEHDEQARDVILHGRKRGADAQVRIAEAILDLRDAREDETIEVNDFAAARCERSINKRRPSCLRKA